MRPRINVDELLSGRQRGFLPGALRCILACAEPIYRLGISARNLSYDSGWRRTFAIDVPVLSIGNITTGGTGKTPVVRWIAEQLLQRNCQPVIVSRGYGSLDVTGKSCNDEFLELQWVLPDVVHLQNPNRVAAATLAVKDHKADVVVLDDGFQHRRLRRCLDIALLDATSPFGYGHLLPRGLLREPRKSLRRADLIMITRVDQVSVDQLASLTESVTKCSDGVPIVHVAFPATTLVGVEGRVNLDSLRQHRAFGFCGIGNPSAFQSRLTQLCEKVVGFESFPDHYAFEQDDVVRLQKRAARLGAQALVCTMKDLVKIQRLKMQREEVFALIQETQVVNGRQSIELAIDRVCAAEK